MNDKSQINLKKPLVGLSPVPVVLVGCIDLKTNKPNIITVGWIGVVCSEPPMISISLRPSRYSYRLIENTKDFTVNIPTSDIVEKVDYCGVVSGKNEDKFEKTGFKPIESITVKSPIIKECPINLECKLISITMLGSHSLFIGKIQKIHADNKIIINDDINFEKLNLLVVNGFEYWDLDKRILNVYGYKTTY